MMRKKVLIIIGVLVAVVAIVILVIMLSKTKYIIKVSMVDDQSPDRILTVYNDKNEKVEFKRIELLDGTVLCNGDNTAVHYGNIKNVHELKVVFKDKSKVVAKVVEEEVE